MKCGFWCVVLIALCMTSALAQLDEPANADTARTDTTFIWADTVVAFSDSTSPQHATLHHGWLYPLSIAAVTCMGLLMLFTLRSR
jgi:hypothetical protein